MLCPDDGIHTERPDLADRPPSDWRCEPCGIVNNRESLSCCFCGEDYDPDHSHAVHYIEREREVI